MGAQGASEPKSGHGKDPTRNGSSLSHPHLWCCLREGRLWNPHQRASLFKQAETIRLENKPRHWARKPDKIGKVPPLIKITEARSTEQLEQKVPIRLRSCSNLGGKSTLCTQSTPFPGQGPASVNGDFGKQKGTSGFLFPDPEAVLAVTPASFYLL